jgi:ribosomal protein L1
MLMHGGQNFEIKVAHTESMSAKEAVKNIIHALVTVSSLVIYSSKVKHNAVHEVYLSTSKTLPLPIITAPE